MNELLSNFGIVAVVCWSTLAVLALTLWPNRRSNPSQRFVLSVLALAISWATPLLLIVRSGLETARPVEASGTLAVVLETLTNVAAVDAPSAAWTPMAWVGLVWVGLSIAGAGWLALSAWRLRQLLERAEPASSEAITEANRVAQVMGVSVPQVVASHDIAAPFVTGVIRHTLVLPSLPWGQLDVPQRTLALKHEFEHVRKRDPLWTLLAQVLAVPFFGHPAARWLLRELAAAREEAVDQAIAPSAPHAYASMLLDFAAQPAARGASISMAASSIERRLQALLQITPRPSARIVPLLGAVVAVVIGLLFSPRLVHAQVSQDDTNVDPNIEVGVERVTVLQIPGMNKITVDDAAIVDAQALPNTRMVLKGLRPGSTQVRVERNLDATLVYRVNVVPKGGERPVEHTLVNFSVNEVREITVPAELLRIAVSNPSVLEVKSGPIKGSHRFELRGIGQGTSSMILWTIDGKRYIYKVHVAP